VAAGWLICLVFSTRWQAWASCICFEHVRELNKFGPGYLHERAFSFQGCAELYCASHKNWIRNIRFSIINRPLSQ